MGTEPPAAPVAPRALPRVSLLRSIRARVVGAFMMALAAMLAAQGTLVWQQGRAAASVHVLTGAYLPLSKTVAQLVRDRTRIDTDVQRILREERRPGTGDSAAANIWTSQLRDNLERGLQEVADARGLDLSAEDQAALHKAVTHLTRIQALFQDYEGASATLVQRAEAGDLEQAEALAAPLRRYGVAISEQIEKLARLIDDRTAALTTSAEDDRARAMLIANVLTALALLFALVLIGAVQYALRPVSQLTTQVQRLAAGDYTGRVDVRSGDEIGVLAAEFSAMVDAIRLRDGTLVERAEELDRVGGYLTSVLDSLVDGLFTLEFDRVTLTNPAAARVWGVIVGGPGPVALREVLAQPGLREVRAPDGTLHTVRTSPVGDGGMVVVTADVTDERAATERLERSERLALVGQMLAQITHEVRNPLNALSLNTELLAEEVERLDPARSTEATELIEVVSGEIDRLTAVTAHYLQLARRPRAQFEAEHLPTIVDDVIRLIQPELAQQDIALTRDLEEVPAQLLDGNQIRQALLNVLRNAAEAGARTLTLSLRAPPDAVRLTLADDGPGMSDQEAARAMDPFFSTKASGSGLGLAITKQIIDDHGGTLTVQPRPEGGTAVTFVLPHRPSPEEPDHVADHPGG